MKFEDKIIKAVIKANTELRPDVQALLAKALRREKNRRIARALEIILENAVIAGKKKLALCQDTGLPIVFIEAGPDISLNSRLIKKISAAVSKGYEKGGFRASAIDRKGKLDFAAGIFHVSFSEKSGLKVTIFPKGFGSENKSRLKMFNPTASQKEIDEFIIKAVKDAGPSACPPFIVGVGIGGTADTSLLLAKEALLEDTNKRSKDKVFAAWENRLLKKINALKIGPMGLGGQHTCLAVKIKDHPTHIAGLPVGVNISCHALRSSSVKFSKAELLKQGIAVSG